MTESDSSPNCPQNHFAEDNKKLHIIDEGAEQLGKKKHKQKRYHMIPLK